MLNVNSARCVVHMGRCGHRDMLKFAIAKLKDSRRSHILSQTTIAASWQASNACLASGSARLKINVAGAFLQRQSRRRSQRA